MSSSATSRFTISSISKLSGAECTSATSEAPAVSDELLMARLKDGDPEAFSLVFHRYQRLVFRICERILRDDAEAEDLTQDVFLHIQAKCGIFDALKGSAVSWIVQKTYQRAFDRRRYLATRQFYKREDIEGTAEGGVGTSTNDQDYSAEAVLGRNGLEKLLRALSQEQRRTLRMYFFEGYTLAEISAKVGEPLGNVRHQYYRGLNKLRKQMFRLSGGIRWWRRNHK